MTTKWKKPAALVIVAAMMMMAIPMMAFNAAAAGDQTYSFYVDLTADRTLNGQWITGTGADAATAFINAANTAYGAANNVISSTGWVTTLNGYSGAGGFGSDYKPSPGTITWAQYGYVTSAWSSGAYLSSSTISTNNQYAIFATEYVRVEVGQYVDGTGTANSAAVLAAATYNGAYAVPTGYTAVAISATDDNADHTWDVSWYLMPTAQVSAANEYVNSGWGYAQRDDCVGLGTLVNMQTLTTSNAQMSASRNVAFTYRSAETKLLGYDVTLTYDQSKLEYVSTDNLCGLSILANGATAGTVSVLGSAATSVDGTTGLFMVTFHVKDSVASTDTVAVGATLNSLATEANQNAFSPPFPTTYALVGLGGSTGTGGLVAGNEAKVSATSDANGKVAVTFDTSVLRFVSVTGATSVVNSNGILTIQTETGSSPVEITFAVVDNPVIGTTTVIANGLSTSFTIAASSFVIVPEVKNSVTTVSLYKVPAIAGFKMVFHYTGSTPMVTDLAGLGNKGSFSTNVSQADHTLTVVWANSVNVDLNGDLFNVSGMTTLTLAPSDAELRSIIQDLSSVRVHVGVAASLEDASNQDPNLSHDLNGDGLTDLADLIALMQYLADFDVSINTKNADYTHDGVVNIVDAMTLQEMITTA